MAQPAGSIIPANWGYNIKDAWEVVSSVDTPIPAYLYIVCRIDLMPKEWAPNNRNDIFHKHSIKVGYVVDSGTSLFYWFTIAKESPDLQSVNTIVGPDNSYANWNASVETEDYDGTFYRDCPGYGNVETNPRYMVIEIRMQRSMTVTNGEDLKMYGVNVEAKNEEAYAGNFAVRFNGNNSSKRIYNDFDSVSTALMNYGVCHNFDKLLYESRQKFCSMFFGTADNVD